MTQVIYAPRQHYDGGYATTGVTVRTVGDGVRVTSRNHDKRPKFCRNLKAVNCESMLSYEGPSSQLKIYAYFDDCKLASGVADCHLECNEVFFIVRAC
jgi:hypothetical protein